MMLRLLLLVCSAVTHQTALRHHRESTTIDRAHTGKVRCGVRHILRVVVEVLNKSMVVAHPKVLERRR
jgi:hypothetical protein